MYKELEEFLCLFNVVPRVSILNLNNCCDDITKILNNLVSPFDGTVTTLDTDVLKELKVKIKRSTYDYGVISNFVLNSADKEMLFQIINKGIRDSGHIIILEEKDKNLDEIYHLLEEYDYGAISSIDIFEDYSLIMGKKLHMWGMD
ncbi:MAG: hypothetical protein U9N59_07985 [Campylobacterota bacterium]|nr:hypothetical protein [Campylobacterota bacterium]